MKIGDFSRIMLKGHTCRLGLYIFKLFYVLLFDLFFLSKRVEYLQQ